MKFKFLTTVLFLFIPLLINAQSFDSIFKSSEWLEEHLGDKNLIILHVDTEENYKSGHIPEAQFIKMSEFTTTTIDSIYREMPPISYLDSLFRARGISDNSNVVLYYGGDLFASAFRLYFTFDYLGLAENVFLLDGGLKTWTNAGLPLSAEKATVKKVKAGRLTIKPNTSLIASKEQVRNFVDSEEVKIIDARRDAYYSGEKDGDGHYKRPGHIASAKNITWLNIVDEDQKLKSSEELMEYFSGQGIKSDDKVITYCHVGLRATVLYTISKSLGHDTKMYDGSYNEWDRLDDDYPVDYTFK